MLFDLFSKKKPGKSEPIQPAGLREQIPQSDLNFSWIITGKLAIGPMPRTREDWLLLENNGIQKRFSCCYPEEHIFSPIPEHWLTREVSLPDHRLQEDLTQAKLSYALNEVLSLVNEDVGPVYLHCFAGQERSSLLAIGAVSRIERKDLFDALAWVRQCYKRSRPLYDHLDILEQVLKISN
jgi:hypothetical protein